MCLHLYELSFLRLITLWGAQELWIPGVLWCFHRSALKIPVLLPFHKVISFKRLMFQAIKLTFTAYQDAFHGTVRFPIIRWLTATTTTVNPVGCWKMLCCLSCAQLVAVCPAITLWEGRNALKLGCVVTQLRRNVRGFDLSSYHPTGLLSLLNLVGVLVCREFTKWMLPYPRNTSFVGHRCAVCATWAAKIGQKLIELFALEVEWESRKKSHSVTVADQYAVCF